MVEKMAREKKFKKGTVVKVMDSSLVRDGDVGVVIDHVDLFETLHVYEIRFFNGEIKKFSEKYLTRVN